MAPPHQQIECDVLFDRLAAAGVWQTPTLVFMQTLPDVFSGAPLAHSEYASESLLSFVRKNAAVSKLDAQALEWLRAKARESLPILPRMKARGVRFLTGSDGLVPGFSLHDELEWFTRAGFSTAEALRAATSDVARYLGREASQGNIKVGHLADLVVLDADPLADIRNTRRIHAVLVRNRLLLAPEIRSILSRHRRGR